MRLKEHINYAWRHTPGAPGVVKQEQEQKVQGHLWPHKEAKDSLEYVKLCLDKSKSKWLVRK